MFLCVLMLCTFHFDVVTAVCQLLINGYVMLCYVNALLYLSKFHLLLGSNELKMRGVTIH